MARLFRFLLILLTASIFQGPIDAYICTLVNKTRATIVVEFYKMNSQLKTESSGDITILPNSENKWDAGKCLVAFPCSISGIKIIQMTMPEKSGTESTKPVPGADKIQEKWTGVSAHAVSHTWVMTEDYPDAATGNFDHIQFILTRTPAGVRGTTYPGGMVWKSSPVEIIAPINPVKGFVPRNKAEYDESCYTYLTGEPTVLFDKMCQNPQPFMIDINNMVPKVYWSSRKEAMQQAIAEKSGEYDPIKRNGMRPSTSHYQTIKILHPCCGKADKEYLVVDSGNDQTWQADLFIAEHPRKSPIDKDWRVVKSIVLNDSPDEKDLWHPAGVDMCGPYLAIPMEDWRIKDYLSKELYPGKLIHYESRSKIIFLDMTDPLNPKRLNVTIERSAKKTRKNPGDNNPSFMPAIGFTRLSDRHYLIYLGGTGDIYISKTDNLNDGFNYSGRINDVPSQNTNFLTIGDKGDLYLVATYNVKNTAPVISGDNRATFYKFNYDPATKKGAATKIKDYNCNCGGGGVAGIGADFGCNFNAGANVTPTGGIIGIYHYVRDGKYLSCTLFGPRS